VSLPERLIRDLKANGPKTAVLGVLVLIGLYFWIPPLWRTMTGPAATASAAATPATAAIDPQPAADATAAPGAAESFTWHDAERLRAEDDLYRTVDPSEIAANAFVFDGGFLPIDVEFGEADPKAVLAEAARTAEAEAAGRSPPAAPSLTLKSTLVGSNARVAVINGRVYPEGATVAAAGRTWTLMNVEPRRVLLDGEGGTLELKIDPFATTRTSAP